MKKILSLLTVGAIVGLVGCNVYAGSLVENLIENDARPLVYTSFHAMYEFTKAIAGDSLRIEVLTPPGASAHHWEPSIQDMVRLSGAEAFIYHGSGMEHFVDALRGSLENEVKFIEASANVEALLGQSDPHLWLNPLYALQIKETIKNGLIEISPENTIVFTANFEIVARMIWDLDEAYRNASEQFVRHDIVVSHAAFGHLSHAYGLNQVAIEGMRIRGDPTPARMVDIISFVRENGVTTIFYDKDSALAESVAAGTGTRTAMLDTFEGITSEDYFTVMWRNLEVLIEALS